MILTLTPYLLIGILFLLTGTTPDSSSMCLLLLVCIWLRIISENISTLLGMGAHACISALGGTETGEFPSLHGQLCLLSEFQASHGYSPFIKNPE